jgi:hypothetical protein
MMTSVSRCDAQDDRHKLQCLEGPSMIDFGEATALEQHVHTKTPQLSCTAPAALEAGGDLWMQEVLTIC